MPAADPKSRIQIKRLPSGYYRAQGDGPCEWAQWIGDLCDKDFFPEASARFRQDLYEMLRRAAENGNG